MPLYEHVYLARQDASAQQVEELTAHLKGVVEGLGGSIAKTEYWGVKSLSYRLRKNRKAHFTLMNLDAPPAAINEIERLERLNEDVLRYLTIRVEEHEEGPSAMMRRAERDRDRDDRRGERGDRFDRGDRATASTAAIEAIARRGIATGARPRALTTSKLWWRNNHGYVTAFRRGTPAVFPPPQELPVLRRQRAEDRLQGRQAAAAVRIGARQDRSEPYHGGFRQEAARACASDQARAVSRAAALRHSLSREDPNGSDPARTGARLGQMGDVVRVKDGFARNFLLPRGKALRATQENRTRFETMKSDLQARSLTLKAKPARSPPSSTARVSRFCARRRNQASCSARCRRAIWWASLRRAASM